MKSSGGIDLVWCQLGLSLDFCEGGVGKSDVLSFPFVLSDAMSIWVWRKMGIK